MPTILFTSPCAVMVRIPKTGSTSVIRGIFGGIDEAKAIAYGSFPEEWKGFFSFCFVRNPFDRLVSAYIMFKRYRTSSKAEESFRRQITLSRILDVVEDENISPIGDSYFAKLKKHSIPITSGFFPVDSVNEIYRFESFPSEYRRLCQQLEIPPGEIPHFRKSDREPYQEYFDAATRARAEKVFQKDCERFGYKFD
jgi:hypothetical protein